MNLLKIFHTFFLPPPPPLQCCGPHPIRREEVAIPGGQIRLGGSKENQLQFFPFPVKRRFEKTILESPSCRCSNNKPSWQAGTCVDITDAIWRPTRTGGTASDPGGFPTRHTPAQVIKALLEKRAAVVKSQRLFVCLFGGTTQAALSIFPRGACPCALDVQGSGTAVSHSHLPGHNTYHLLPDHHGGISLFLKDGTGYL